MKNIERYIDEGKKIVIFPYGKIGRIVHRIFVGTYHVKEIILADSFPKEQHVLSAKELENYSADENIVVFLCVVDIPLYEKLYEQLNSILPKAIIIDGLRCWNREDIADFLSDRHRINSLENRMNELEKSYRNMGFEQMGGRIDYRLTRLEMLQYYSKEERYNELNLSQRNLLAQVDEKVLATLPRKFPLAEYETNSEIYKDETIVNIKKDGTLYYWDFFDKKVYLSTNYIDAVNIATNLYREFFEQNPHNYFDIKEKYDFNCVPSNIVIADVGAAEGLFGIMFIERCKKLYLFENNEYWLGMLKKTYEPYMDKVVIVDKTVGDGKNGISLDDFFTNKEFPELVKMDVEGYEPAVLRGMSNLISNDKKMTLLICTYHRQGDWDYFYDLLSERFDITSSEGYFWHMPDAMPPFFRHGVMRCIKKINQKL